MYKVLTLAFFLLVAYGMVRLIGRSHPQVQAATEEVARPLRVLQDVMGESLQGTPLSRWLGLPPKRYVPNPYGSGGLDPAGGERKGGNGRGIPDQVEVGWWTGEDVTYPVRRLSPVHDEEQRPPEAKVAEVGWWGEDWMV